MKVLFISGYTGEAMVHHGILTGPKVNFLQKPFTRAALGAKIHQILDALPAGASGGMNGRPRSVLVIDDELPVRDLIGSILESLGFEVFVAASGQEARHRIKTHPIDVVITDLVMPEEEGIEIIRGLRKSHPALKIVAMSGAFGSEVLHAASRLGAHATLSKPLTIEKVRRCIETL
jgi:CheY-like chemotaxis protein